VRIIGVPRTSTTRYDFSWGVIETLTRLCVRRQLRGRLAYVKLLDRAEVKEGDFLEFRTRPERENTRIRR